ncbi:NAD(P)/FAD-dependent oxidoreductase [Synechococcus sp. CCY 9618]|uniref:NAD(P)/FAD-dependent oxidoreductase n=1 Tax=Synechococcus sp. CCY 9618 TaxID=2815602 RepID=UPI001C22ADA1|nr:NAD(P)/FAD-dependent oxidoreductase [Synechococcus sp. CCY 9618]
MLPSRVSVVVVGGGPAGFMAAITAATADSAGSRAGEVLLLEATPEPLHKVLISGGGRCNVTHACWDPRLLADHYPRGGRALRGPFSRFAAGDTVAWFEAHGLELVEEPDGRMFPRSNRSTSVVDTLRQAALAAGVRVQTAQAGQAAEALAGGGFRLRLRSGAEVQAERLVLATGSHPSGHRIATSLGHGLVAPVPSLFSLTLAEHPLAGLAGVAMDPVQLELVLAPLEGAATLPREAPQRQRGAVLITHWGLSGPATLRLTAFAARVLRQRSYRAELRVDWTGGRRPADLEELFSAARREQARRQMGNWRPWPDLSRRLWLHLLDRHGVDASLRWADLTRRGELALISALRDSRYPVAGRGPFGEEFVTAGGVPLSEVNLATMESRLQPGLFLVGELLDVDGVTGGFNFQHCWSSGWLAGKALAAQRMCS